MLVDPRFMCKGAFECIFFQCFIARVCVHFLVHHVHTLFLETRILVTCETSCNWLYAFNLKHVALQKNVITLSSAALNCKLDREINIARRLWSPLTFYALASICNCYMLLSLYSVAGLQTIKAFTHYITDKILILPSSLPEWKKAFYIKLRKLPGFNFLFNLARRRILRLNLYLPCRRLVFTVINLARRSVFILETL